MKPSLGVWNTFLQYEAICLHINVGKQYSPNEARFRGIEHLFKIQNVSKENNVG